MSTGLDTMAVRTRARNALQRASAVLDPDTVAALFGDIVALCAEVERYRDGAQTRTLEEAAQLAAFERALPRHLTPNERNAAVMARTGFKRSKVYRLRELARRPV